MDRGQQFPDELSMEVKRDTRKGIKHVRILAHHPEHGHIGTMTVVEEGNDEIPTGYIGNIIVDPDHVRKGVATAMARRAQEEIGAPLVHSETRTEEGDAWAKSWGGPLPPREDPK